MPPTERREREAHLEAIRSVHSKLAKVLGARRSLLSLQPKYDTETVRNLGEALQRAKSDEYRSDLAGMLHGVLKEDGWSPAYAKRMSGFIVRLASEGVAPTDTARCFAKTSKGPEGDVYRAPPLHAVDAVEPVLLESARKGHASPDLANILLFLYDRYALGPKERKDAVEHFPALRRLYHETERRGMAGWNLSNEIRVSFKNDWLNLGTLKMLTPVLTEAAQHDREPASVLEALLLQMKYLNIKDEGGIRRLAEHARLAWQKGRRWHPSDLFRHAAEANETVQNYWEVLRLQREILEKVKTLPTKKLLLKLWETKE
jgi:hypothetical protein